MEGNSEVKGSWFVSARAHLLDAMGEAGIEGVVARMGEHAECLRDPLSGRWYPEIALQTLLHALDDELGNDKAKFEAAMMGATRQGVNTFFKTLLSLTTSRFLLRQVPVLWRMLRRKDGATIKVESEGQASVVHYSDFPWYEDPLYRRMAVATLKAMVELNAGVVPEGRVVDWSRSSLTVRIEHPG